MDSLFWKSKGKTKSLIPTPFKTEDEFERHIFETPEILEDIFLLKRQVKGGKKSGIPDIIGINAEGKVCIIEMKNTKVDASIIPQVLQYAFWAETNPDSIKTLWLECEEKPDDIPIAWESLEVKIIVIAPTILRSTMDIVEKINYEVDLIEVKRWVEAQEDIYFVHKLDIEEKPFRITPVKGRGKYDADYYKKEYNKQTAIHFLKYIKIIEEMIRKNGWKLETKHNKFYCGFKAGFRNAFGIKWISARTLGIFLKISEPDMLKFEKEQGKIKERWKYDAPWKEVLIYIDLEITNISKFKELFEKSYKNIIGE